jgi:hypothetical protein
MIHTKKMGDTRKHPVFAVIANVFTIIVACLLSQAAHAERPVLQHAPPDIYQVSPEEEGPSAIKAWGNRISAAFQWSDFKTLESWCADYTTHQTRFRDGKWAVDLMAGGFDAQFTGVTPRYNRWDADYKKLKKWEEMYPDSSCAPVVEAEYWETYAWHARGNGYKESVTPEGWALFTERLEKAKAVLEKSAALSKRNPAWFTQMLVVGKGLNWPHEKMVAMTYHANDLFPTYFQASLSAAAALTPRWGGSWDEVHAFVQNMVKRTHFVVGTAMYTRIYWHLILLERIEFRPFDKVVDWDMMASGFRTLRRAQPDSDWILNNFAAFACRANDQKTYRELRKQINDDKFNWAAWPSNYSIDVCDQRMHYGT